MLLVVESVWRAEDANPETSKLCSSSMIRCFGCSNPDDTIDEIDRPVAEIPEIVCESAAFALAVAKEDREMACPNDCLDAEGSCEPLPACLWRDDESCADAITPNYESIVEPALSTNALMGMTWEIENETKVRATDPLTWLKERTRRLCSGPGTVINILLCLCSKRCD